ncbi:hydroxyphenylacetyl-CoA thioesterase PaaI [Pontibacter diazotrophicus]|uniref:Hydroxyphenylacetyl-CoA thioesterase PaaI n=1 Tax=Pontibacter diazotrophicus TaxID=1400979 RepID=A0A3D8LDF9_9BACT|nr:hydroxyphenylacetyl-CoA thioesterase PaaI [Pontibacter diazotrophicus]RDV15383.1 hydroxyphenylacetyl-CoA thioesterase PaaI [Pontibacter diazotrophicus]
MSISNKSIPKAEAVLHRMMAKDAFSKLLGLQVDEVGEGYCRLHFKVREDMLNGFGILHGGVTYSAADSAFAFACNSHGRLSVALSTNMDYLEAGKLGDTLTVEAKEESLKNKVGVYQIRITNQEDVLVALFKGTSYRTSKEI